jgi:hypothetical protein
MRHVGSMLAVAAVLFGAAACDNSPSPVAPTIQPAASTKVPKLISFTFTKIPGTVATQAIASPVSDLATIAFQMDAAEAGGIVVKQLGFMIAGSLQAGDVGNYQLFYYPKGLTRPGVLMGTNDGSTWVAPGGFSFIYIDLATPITIPNGKNFTAVFALHADVNGTGTFFFYPRVQTCLVNQAGVDKDVLWLGGDLPLQGDTYFVN